MGVETIRLRWVLTILSGIGFVLIWTFMLGKSLVDGLLLSILVVGVVTLNLKGRR